MSGMLQRLDFNSIKKKYVEDGKKNVRLTESTLVLIQPITPNKTNYNFPVLDTNTATTVLPEEIRLNINDEFIVGRCGIYLLGSVFDGTLPIPNEANQWFSYVPMEMASSLVVLQPLYSGFMKIDVNTINYVDKWDIKKHEYRGETQFQNASIGQVFATFPNIRFDTDGMVKMTPNVTLSGAKKNDVNIILNKSLSLPPAFAVTTAVAGFADVVTVNINRIAVVFRGLLAQNASDFQGASKKG